MILNLIRVNDLSVEDMIKRSFSEFHAQKALSGHNLLKTLQICEKKLNCLFTMKDNFMNKFLISVDDNDLLRYGFKKGYESQISGKYMNDIVTIDEYYDLYQNCQSNTFRQLSYLFRLNNSTNNNNNNNTNSNTNVYRKIGLYAHTNSCHQKW